MSKQEKIKEIRDMVGNPQPTIDQLLTTDELAFFLDCAPDIASPYIDQTVMVFCPIERTDEMLAILDKLKPLGRKFARMPVVADMDELKKHGGGVTVADAVELKKLWR